MLRRGLFTEVVSEYTLSVRYTGGIKGLNVVEWTSEEAQTRVWDAASVDLRRMATSLDDVASELTGLSARARVSVSAMRASPQGSIETFEHANIQGNLGIERRQPHVSVSYQRAFGDASLRAASSTLAGEPLAGGLALVKEFSTASVLRVDRRVLGGAKIDEVSFLEGFDGPADLLVANRDRFERSPEDIASGVTLTYVTRIPVAWMIADVYLHRSVRVGLPRAGVFYPGSRHVGSGLDGREFDRLAHIAPPAMIGSGDGGSMAEINPEHARLTRYLFDQTGWDPGEFTHYRWLVERPLWAMDYVISFGALP